MQFSNKRDNQQGPMYTREFYQQSLVTYMGKEAEDAQNIWICIRENDSLYLQHTPHCTSKFHQEKVKIILIKNVAMRHKIWVFVLSHSTLI